MDLFNKSKIKQLEAVVHSQSNELKESNSLILSLKQRMAYQEAELAAKVEVIETLKKQLEHEMNQKETFQKTFLQFYTPSKQQVKEEVSGMFVEDDEMVKEITSQFNGLGEGDL